MFALIDKSKGYLFSTYLLQQRLQQQLVELRKEVAAQDASRILNVSPADLAQSFADKYQVEPIVLRREDRYMTEQETQIDVRRDPHRHIRDRHRPALVPGQRIEIMVPFSGDAELFYGRSNRSTSSPPEAIIRGSELVLVYEFPVDNAPNIGSQAERLLGDIEQHLSWGRPLIDAHNNLLVQEAAIAIESRRNQLLANQGRAASLGIPIKARSDAPKTNVIPEMRRKTTAVPQQHEWEVFISHASEDKGAIARPLAKALEAEGMKVWFDEATLTLGDSLRQAIERGLSRSRYGIVILSEAFFSKHWTQQELDGLAAREVGGVKVILPVWHGVDQATVAHYSPMLAGRLATLSSRGIPTVVADILKVVRK